MLIDKSGKTLRIIRDKPGAGLRCEANPVLRQSFAVNVAAVAYVENLIQGGIVMLDRKFLTLVVLSPFAWSCGPSLNVNKPIADSATATKTYVQAKKEYVTQLEGAIVGSNAGASKYRLVSVVGPQWNIGAVLDPDNPLNNITDKCAVKDTTLPKPTPWASLPGMSQSKKITLGAGLPSKVTEFLGKESAVSANLTTNKTGQFSLSELASVIVAEDEFNNGFSTDCAAVLALKGGLVVRGIVTGKEVFKSGTSLVAGANVKLAETDLLKLQFDNKGDFELEDKTATPKMFLITQFVPQNKSDGEVQRKPSAETIARIEALDKNKP